MCTVAWKCSGEQDYELIFNRDELWERLPACDPAVEDVYPLSGICSRDGNAGGTWLFTNHAGLTLCLLNAYPEDFLPDGKVLRTRGELPLLAGFYENTAALSKALREIDLSQYAPFCLLAISASEQQSFEWDGLQLCEEKLPKVGFVTSSSVRTDAVIKARRKRFAILQAEGHSLNICLNDTVAEHPSEAIFVTRDDGGSVSQTQIQVLDGSLRYRYTTRANAAGVKFEFPLLIATSR